MRESKAMCEALGPGWKPAPFALGKWWMPCVRCGAYISLYPEKGVKPRDRYLAYFALNSICTARGATPRSTAKKLMALMGELSEAVGLSIEAMKMKKRA